MPGFTGVSVTGIGSGVIVGAESVRIVGRGGAGVGVGVGVGVGIAVAVGAAAG